MRIGFFTDSYIPRLDGIALSVETFRVGLEELGHQVYIFCPRRPGSAVIKNPRVIQFPSLPSISYEGLRDSWPFLPKYAKSVRALDLDIVHTHTQLQMGVFGTYIAKSQQLPLVTTIHADLQLVHEYKRAIPGMILLRFATAIAAHKKIHLSEVREFLEIKRPLHDWQTRVVREAVSFYNEQCDLVVVPSDKIKRQLQQKRLKTPIQIIPTGIDMKAFDTVPPAKSFFSEQGLPRDAKLIISTTRLVKEKNVALLLRAFARICNTHPEAYLVIVGDGPEKAALQSLSRRLRVARKVIFTGRLSRQQVFGLLKVAAMFANVCLRETQGLTILEAAAAGLPIIMVDAELADMLQQHKNGYFASATASDVAKKLHALLADDKTRQQFGVYSRQLAKNLSARKQAQVLAACYIQLGKG